MNEAAFWTKMLFKGACEFTSKPRGFRLPESEAVPFVPMELIPERTLYSSNFLLKSPSSLTSGTYFESGDILLAKITPCFENGKQTIFSHLPQAFGFATTEVIPFKERPGISDREFLFFYLLLPDVRADLAAKMEGTTGRQRLNKASLENLPIVLPSVTEQRAIAHVLKSVQKAKDTRQRELALERERKTALMEHLFTCGTRGEDTKQSDIGDIPNGWDVSALADVAVISSGGTPDRTKAEYWGGAIPWVRTGEIRYNTILATEERITQEGLDNSSAKVYPRGTLLMAMYGQGVTRGKVAILGIDASINQACAAITPRNGRLLPRFAFYYLQFTYERVRILGHGANQKNLNSHLVGSIQVPIPTTEEQLEIARVFSAMDAKLDAIDREIGILEELFGVMLQQLVTGGVSVSNLVAGEHG